MATKGIENARREAEWMFAHVLQCQRLDLYLRFDMPMDSADVDALRGLVARRGKREPLAYLLGSQPFCGLDLQVSADVLVPRPETEELAMALLAVHPEDPGRGRSVVDVGTGSGALALVLAQARPSWQVHGCDISPAALQVAAQNADRHGISVQWHVSDLLAACPGPWDLIVSNPPYIAEAERDLCDPELAFEPAGALFSPEDGLQHLRRLIEALPAALTTDGEAWVEHGFQQATALRGFAQSHGYQATSHRDGAGNERWTVLRRAGK